MKEIKNNTTVPLCFIIGLNSAGIYTLLYLYIKWLQVNASLNYMPLIRS